MADGPAPVEETPAGGAHERAFVPTVEAVTKASLREAPAWLRKIISNAVALLGWVGLPSTVISTLSELKWVLDAARWLYAHAGPLRPLAEFLGDALIWLADAWRAITHPLWHALAERLGIALPAWVPDVLTLALIIFLGALRYWLRAVWGHRISGALMWRAARDPQPDYIPMPRTFPYAAHFADHGLRMGPKQRADAQRLWRKWRRLQIGVQLTADGSRWPRFHPEALRAQFGRFYLSVIKGRRDMILYAGIAAAVALALTADALLRGGLS